MKQGPAIETFSVGPMLRDSAAVAIRHWPIVLLGLIGVAVWSLVILFVVGRSVASAGVSPEVGDTLAKFGLWFGLRFVTWFILGSVVYRIVTAEADIQAARQSARDPRLRLLLACVLCFAIGSLIGWWTRVAMLFGLDALGLPGPDYEDNPFSSSVLMEAMLIIIVEAYIAARIAVFAAALLQRPQQAAFGLSWTAAAGTRLKLFLVIGAIDLAIFVMQLGIIAGLPRAIDLHPAARWLSDFTLLPHEAALDRLSWQIAYLINVIMAALYAGAVIVLHRWQVGSEVRTFD